MLLFQVLFVLIVIIIFIPGWVWRTPYYNLPWYYRILVQPLMYVVRALTNFVNWLDRHI